jgi:hypothetical protein
VVVGSGLTVVKTSSSLTEGNVIQSLKFFKCKKFEMTRFETDQSDKTQKDIFQDKSSKIRSNFVTTFVSSNLPGGPRYSR